MTKEDRQNAEEMMKHLGEAREALKKADLKLRWFNERKQREDWMVSILDLVDTLGYSVASDIDFYDDELQSYLDSGE